MTFIPANKTVMLVALGLIALWAMYIGDKVTLATIVGAFIMMLKQN